MQDRTTEKMRRAGRTAALAALVVAGLAAMKILVGRRVDSSALVADGVHSAADLLALGASWFGLRLASKPPSERFPFGYYRAESLAALFVSLVIMVMGGRIFLEGVGRIHAMGELGNELLAVSAAGLSLVTALLLFFWERKAADRWGSQSLSATAEEMKVDVFTSLLVMVALVASRYHVPYIEGGTTILIAGLVVAIGARSAWGALLSLMDATVDPALEEEARRILEGLPGVKNVEKLRARKAGPCFFVEGHIRVSPSMDVTRTHLLSHDAQARIKSRFPEVESVLLHVEPFSGETKRVMIPVQGVGGLGERVCPQFSRAPYFVRVVLEKDKIKETRVLENPFSREKIHAGLAVFHELIESEGIDVVLARQVGEIVYHVLRDHGIETFEVPTGISAEDALRRYVDEGLPYLTVPVHPSQSEKGGEGGGKAVRL